MNERPTQIEIALPQVGCGLVLILLASLCLLPWLLVHVLEAALVKLHLSSFAVGAATFGILLGGLINLPLYEVEHAIEPANPPRPWSALQGWVPLSRRDRYRTIVALNVGGCLVPLVIVMHELKFVLSGATPVPLALLLAVGVNVVLCWQLARPVPGIGIALPFFVSPAAAVGMAWLLLSGEAFDSVRAPVAFIAGVCGPLIGADLLNLRKFERMSAGVISIGGAGTFDGIVLSGILAALLA